MINRKRSVCIWAAMLAFVLVGVSTVVVLSLPSSAVTYVAGSLPRGVDASDRLRSKGTDDAAVQVVVYSDFQCPGCAAFAEALDGLPLELSQQLRVVYRHYPVPQHHNAVIAAIAAEAAGQQNRFWAMHDVLFRRQKDWAQQRDPFDTFVGYARELGLDLRAFEEALQSEAVMMRVKATHDEAAAVRLRTTPAVFVNGRLIGNAMQPSVLKGAIHDAIQNKR